jgi:hypothetical protein
MTFVELQERARILTPEQIESSLALLMRDPRFPAMLRVLSDHRESLMVGVCGPQVAGRPEASSIMAHGLGGVDAILSIESRLHGLLE